MYEPTKKELEQIEAELRAEKGQEIERDDYEDYCLREDEKFLNRIDMHINSQSDDR